jgi:Putative lumazine-binding
MHPRLATIAALIAIAALRPPSSVLAQDSAGVRAAALDYIEGFYTGDSTRLVRSVRPEVYKYGFWRHRDSTNYNAGTQMTWEGFHRYANGVKERGGRGAPANAPKEVRIFEVLDKTASAKVTAWWGIDYLLLGKFDGRWMITHVLWQSPPGPPASH